LKSVRMPWDFESSVAVSSIGAAHGTAYNAREYPRASSE
jgi:hypothetical protein